MTKKLKFKENCPSCLTLNENNLIITRKSPTVKGKYKVKLTTTYDFGSDNYHEDCW